MCRFQDPQTFLDDDRRLHQSADETTRNAMLGAVIKAVAAVDSHVGLAQAAPAADDAPGSAATPAQGES
jgi:hypothetical protein